MSDIKDSLLPANDQYELQGMTPLEAALSKKRKKLAMEKIGLLSEDDKKGMGLING